MRVIFLAIVLLIKCQFTQAEIVEFDLSPPGTDAGVGLAPNNEIIPGFGAGSGNEIGRGIFLDTSTKMLTLDFGYGSDFGFTDLTGPAFSWLLHGPSPVSETAPVIFNLESFHTYAVDPIHGGIVNGIIALSAEQEAQLLGGLTYVNIYTAASMGGEIRGQLVVVPELSSVAFLLVACGSILLCRGFSLIPLNANKT